MLSTRPYTPDDFGPVTCGLELSQWDRVEALDVSGASTVPEALEECLKTSDCTWVIEDTHGTILGVYGYACTKYYAIPWMLGDARLHTDYALSLCKGSRKIVAEWKAELPRMYNLVWQENTRSIKWLKFLGFTFGDHVPIKINGHLYLKFHMEQ